MLATTSIKRHTPSDSHIRQVWAVRTITREIVWLAGQVRWQMGHVVWYHPQYGVFAPTPADLARVQHRLNKVRQYDEAAQQVVGDVDVWLHQYRTHLATATLLQPLVAPDLPALVTQVPSRDPALIHRLADLLLAEALCINSLSASPARALLVCGRAAYPVLRRMGRDTRLPEAVRALAALTLGALHQREEQPVAPAADWHTLTEPWLRRAFAWGQQHGINDDPWLLVRFLSVPDGDTLTQHYQQILQALRRFCPGNDMLRDLFARGAAPAQVVALLEALAEVEPPGRRILVAKPLETRKGKQQKGKKAGVLRPVDFPLSARRQAVSDLRGILHGAMQSTADPAVIRLIRDFCQAMLTLTSLCPDLVEALLLPLRQGLDLPAHLQQPYLALLVEHHSQIWNVSHISAHKKPKAFSGWLRSCWENTVQPLLIVLRESGDPAVVREALELGIIQQLAHQRPLPDRYPVLLEIVRYLGIEQTSALNALCRMLNSFATPRKARTALHPLVLTIRQASIADQIELLVHILHAVKASGRNHSRTLRRLLPYVVRLTRCAHLRNLLSLCGKELVMDILTLDAAQPAQGVAWFERMLVHLHNLSQAHLANHSTWDTIQLGLRLGVALADGEMQQFERVFGATLRHQFAQSPEYMEDGIKLLVRFPGLRTPLRQLFAQQPQHCADILARLGMAACLGVQALDPLHDLEADPAAFLAHHTLPADWQIILDEAPDLLLLAGTYLHARHLCGAVLTLPGGVRKALEQPRKLHTEAQHLACLVANHPQRVDLAARLASLRTRLSNQQRMQQQAHQEARERLHQITAEAQLVAAEQQLLVCFRERLEEIIGRRVPVALSLDDDLLNAILLSVDIQTNRRLLRDLLRAHLRGDHDWREQHPANAAFLEKLAARGVDVATWLSDFPRIYRCTGAHGGRVWLTLERDPLRILQMGNYFNTCLSISGWNAFATVANACELNKRVIYARDETGRVVGRKLIAINDAGDLVGFYNYTSLSDECSNNHLRAILREYGMLVAAQCGLRLSTYGTVPVLFAQGWYDDGMVSWDEETADTVEGRRKCHR